MKIIPGLNDFVTLRPDLMKGNRCKVIETGQNFSIRAIWASVASPRSVHDAGFPLVSFFADPPMVPLLHIQF